MPFSRDTRTTVWVSWAFWAASCVGVRVGVTLVGVIGVGEGVGVVVVVVVVVVFMMEIFLTLDFLLFCFLAGFVGGSLPDKRKVWNSMTSSSSSSSCSFLFFQIGRAHV